jgi:branched-chain amino acid transport system permease protein
MVRSEILRRSGRFGALAGFVLLAVGLGIVGGLAPATFLTDLVGTACGTAILVLSWTVFCGPTREISFGHSFFFGGAGYAAGLAQARLGWNPWLALALGAVCGAGLGAGVAVLTARHRGLFFSMVTMALQLAFFRVLFLGSAVLGGEEGVVGVRSLAASRMGIYTVAAGALMVVCLAAWSFLRSRTGLLLGAFGQHEELALGLGAHVPRLRLQGLTLGGALAGIGGALYVLTQGQANAELASSEASLRILLAGMVGGMWSLPGAVAAAFGLQGLQALLFRWGRQDTLIYLAILLVLVLALPRGLVPIRPRWDRARIPFASRRSRPTEDGPGFAARQVELRFGGIQALGGVTLEVARGTAVGLIGPNGAGKTTLLNVITGARKPDSGEVLWAGRSLGSLDVSARARLGVRKTHQHVVSFPDLSLREHLAVARAASGCGDDGPELEALIMACIGGSAEETPIGELPPAAARMTEIAMALAAPPELLLLDEPFAALSGGEVEAVCAGIRALQRRGVTMIIVEHRLHELFRLVDDVVALDQGRVIARKAPAEVLRDPAVRAAYGVGLPSAHTAGDEAME